ncbi:MAG: hypothetical protein GY851_06420, partial [bacterium]|nr:hypothetical protein [bacterium]
MMKQRNDSRVRSSNFSLFRVGAALAALALAPMAQAAVWFVDVDNTLGLKNGASWATAFDTIQPAIDAAFDDGGGEVWVAEGVYDELRDNPTGSVILKDDVELYGGFEGTESLRSERDWDPHVTTIDGSTARAGSPAYHVVSANNITDAALDGFGITGGNADGGGENANGAGMHNTTSSPTVTNCRFYGNVAVYGGGGMCAGEGCSPTVTNCVFADNTAATQVGGGMFTYGATSIPILTGCVFVGNSSRDGGGMFNSDASPSIQNCLFTRNQAGSGRHGGGFANYQASASPSLSKCFFVGNQATHGGAMAVHAYSSPSSVNCVFAGNHASSTGGVAYVNGSSPSYTNCTFLDNTAGFEGAVISADASSSSSISSCILRGNPTSVIVNRDTSTTTVTYSDVEGGYTGAGNIDEDPQFVGGPSGTSTGLVYRAATFKSTLSDTSKTYVPGGLVGAILWVGAVGSETAYYIAANDSKIITVWGDATESGAVVSPVDYAVVDYHLKDGSLCSDAGTNTGAPANDIDGDARPYNGTVDMGADEYDPATSDSDGDGLTDAVEKNTGTYVSPTDTGTDPLDPDSDTDGMWDGWEVANGLDPNDDTGDNGAAADLDSDNLTNLEEHQNVTDPNDADTDDDGANDALEIDEGTDPNNGDSFPAGAKWFQATDDAPWAKRSVFSSVQFNRSLWVMGGYITGSDDCTNDVWKSSDGAHWTRATDGAAWQARYGHASVVHDGRIWVMGGSPSNAVYLRDVWYSKDGTSWTQATASAGWTGRYAPSSVVYEGKIWIFGGYNITGGHKGDVWYSSDGSTWTQATSSAPWTVRSNHKSIVYGGKMWVIGGKNAGPLDDVWSSSNGIAWTKETDAAPWIARCAHGAVAYEGKQLLFGGQNGLGTARYNDVWATSNGTTWSEITDSASWSRRYHFQSVVHRDAIWLMGGSAVTVGNMNDVWYSYRDEDGDGLPDTYEDRNGLDRADPYEDDGPDADVDGDGLTNIEEYEAYSEANDPDTDDDGINDYDEVRVYGTLPSDVDSDSDGFTDGAEVALGFDPLDDASVPPGRVPFAASTQIDGAAAGARAVCAADMDKDGDLDVIVAAYDADSVVWWENDGAGGWAFEHIIDDETADGPYDVCAADIDRDG